MMLENSESSKLSFIVHKNHYELILHTHTSLAVDELTQKFELIYSHHALSQKPVCTLTRSTQRGLTPLHYALSKGYQLAKRYGDLPKSRSVFVLDNYGLAKSLNSFLRVPSSNIEFRYLTAHEIPAALEWLNEWFVEV